MKKLVALALLFASVQVFAKPVLVTSPFKGVAAGTIVVRHGERALYLILGAQALRYPVAVPKRGQEWSGSARINGKYSWPAWSPPSIVKRDHPELPNVIPGGDPTNPMGAGAMTLDRDEYAIHGTARTARSSIGTAASYGCVRMFNEDIVDLMSRVRVGMLVLMRK